MDRYTEIIDIDIVGVSRDCPIFRVTSLLSQERVKLRASNFVRTFTGSIGTMPVKNFGKSTPWAYTGTLENFQDTHKDYTRRRRRRDDVRDQAVASIPASNIRSSL